MPILSTKKWPLPYPTLPGKLKWMFNGGGLAGGHGWGCHGHATLYQLAENINNTS